MSYTLQRFGTIVLPRYNRKTDATPVQPRQALLATASGAFDAFGSNRAPQKFPHAITISCILSEATAAAMRTNIDALRAAVGTRAKLSRVADDDLTIHQCTARLLDMDYQRSVQNRQHQELKLIFQQLDNWTGKRAEDWAFDEGETFDDGLHFNTGEVLLTPPATGAVSITSNLPATDVRISLYFDGVDTDPAQIVIPEAGVCLVISGPWAASDVLAIDSAARTITLNGADAYSRLDLSGYLAYEHTAPEWLRLAIGTNAIIILGGSFDHAILEYAEAWA